MAYEALKADVAEDGREGGGVLRDDGAQGSGADEETDSEVSQEDDSTVSPQASSMVYKAWVANLVVFGAGAIASAMMISWPVAVGFAAGYMIGVANILFLFNIAKKGVKMTCHKAGQYVASRYYLRYTATIIALCVLIATGLVKAWPALAGLTVCIFTTIVSMVFAAREEVR